MRDGRLVADGPAAANIPGVVAGLDHLYRQYGSGKVNWAELIEPAIALADDGFILDEALPTSIAEGRSFLEKYPEAARIFLPGGQRAAAGRSVRQQGLRRDAARDRAGRRRDVLSRRRSPRRSPPTWSRTAASSASPTWRSTARSSASRCGPLSRPRVYAGGPPVSTGIQLFESLQILEQLPAEGRRAVDDRRRLLALPDRVVEGARSDAPRRRSRAVARGLRRASRRRPRGDAVPADRSEEGVALRAADAGRRPLVPPPTRIGTGTTSFAVADADGNMIAVTQTLSTWGGTFYVSKGLGFLYNNHLRSYAHHARRYGSLVPLMRSSTASVPTLVFAEDRGGRSAEAGGGLRRQRVDPASSVYNIITSVIDGGLGAQAAIEAPRFLLGARSGRPARRTARASRSKIAFPRAVLAGPRGARPPRSRRSAARARCATAMPPRSSSMPRRAARRGRRRATPIACRSRLWPPGDDPVGHRLRSRPSVKCPVAYNCRVTRLITLALALPLIGAMGQTPPSARQASALQSELIVATRDDDTLRQWTEWRAGATLETVTELRPETPAFAIARVSGCLAEGGRCNVSLDYTIYRPDGTVFKELKLQPVEQGKTVPSLRFTLTATDPPGLYRVVATIRDLHARRTQRPERIFGLRIE